jgi:hypothetical protein
MEKSKEEIIKDEFKNNFLDIEYLELYEEAMQIFADQETAKLKKEYEFEINKLQSEIQSLQSALDNIAERGNY